MKNAKNVIFYRIVKKREFIIAKRCILWYNAVVEDLAFLPMILINNFKEIYQ